MLPPKDSITFVPVDGLLSSSQFVPVPQLSSPPPPSHVVPAFAWKPLIAMAATQKRKGATHSRRVLGLNVDLLITYEDNVAAIMAEVWAGVMGKILLGRLISYLVTIP